MSKKRKTRKQKEHAHLHQAEEVRHIHIDAPTYSVDGLKTEKIKLTTEKTNISPEDKDKAYLRHDILAISAASGIIIAFDILLYALLTIGNFRLNFLGY